MLEKMLVKNCIKLDLKGTNKVEVIDELIELLYLEGRLNDKEEFKETILKRERQSSTGLEEGIAIPHGKSNSVKIPTIAFGLSKEGIDYDSLDGEPSKLFFMIAAPSDATDSHIETLSALTTLLLDDSIREKLLSVKTKDDVLNILLNSHKQDVSHTTDLATEKNKVLEYQVLAVTACPTGIAHTYMAAEALNKKAKEMGVTIKVETNGSTGAKNVLTSDEIEKATGVIIAADKNVDLDRFNGKHVEIVGVKEGIKNPSGLIENALNKVVPMSRTN